MSVKEIKMTVIDRYNGFTLIRLEVGEIIPDNYYTGWTPGCLAPTWWRDVLHKAEKSLGGTEVKGDFKYVVLTGDLPEQENEFGVICP